MGPPSDLFSAATLLHEMLAGAKPFPERHACHALARALLTRPAAAAPRPRRPPWPRCWRARTPRSPGRRFASAHEMAAALAASLDGADADEHTVVRPRGTAPPAALDPAVVLHLESTLARYVGPLARHLVRSAAARAGSTAALREALAGSIGRDDHRSDFLRESGLHGERSIPGVAASAVPAATLPPEVLERVGRELARHVGPLARVLVRRAAAGAGDEAALRRALAPQLPDAAARAAFLRG